jgi:hypothetical protein
MLLKDDKYMPTDKAPERKMSSNLKNSVADLKQVKPENYPQINRDIESMNAKKSTETTTATIATTTTRPKRNCTSPKASINLIDNDESSDYKEEDHKVSNSPKQMKQKDKHKPEKKQKTEKKQKKKKLKNKETAKAAKKKEREDYKMKLDSLTEFIIDLKKKRNDDDEKPEPIKKYKVIDSNYENNTTTTTPILPTVTPMTTLTQQPNSVPNEAMLKYSAAFWKLKYKQQIDLKHMKQDEDLLDEHLALVGKK